MMLPFERSLPFTVKGAYNGFAKVDGILHVEPNHLILEFVVQDSLFGALKSGAKEIRVPYNEMHGMKYVRGLFKSHLELKIKSLRTLRRFPGAKDGCLTCKIKRRFKEEAEDITNYVNLRIAEIGLEALERER